MRKLKKNDAGFALLRITFGVVWAIDAAFKWTPAFLSGLPDYIAGMMQGQPTFVADWLNLWLKLINLDPHAFAVGIAVIETALAICLIFNLFPRATMVVGFWFSLLIWSIGEAFGGPYTVGSTDIGAAIIYAFVFAALWIDLTRQENGEVQKTSGGKTTIHIAGAHEKSRAKNTTIPLLSLAVIILAAIIIEPYIYTQSEIVSSQLSAQSMQSMQTMSAMGSSTTSTTATSTQAPADAESIMAGMMAKTFPLDSALLPDDSPVPIPTISFTLAKDALDGWDLHVTTTNFTFTPQNINQAPVADRGHVHLYIDGALTVVLAPWLHLDDNALSPGKHIVTASLNANDHSTFTYQGKDIEQTQTIYVAPVE